MALAALAYPYVFLGSYSKAIQYQEQGLMIAREIKDRALEASTLNHLATSYYGLKNYPKAIEYLEQSLIISRETKDRR